MTRIMLNQLENYYRSKGILSTNFSCPHKNQCSSGCETFTGPKSAFVSSGYEKAVEVPRLLFLSLDSGCGAQNEHDRLPEAVRQQNEVDRDTLTLHKHKHWYRTHELAYYIFRRFNPDLEVQDVKHHFAHANSAKCCMNKKQKKQADKVLFKNCREYLGQELEILNPKIIVTQGNEAKFGIEKCREKTLKVLDQFAQTIELNGKPVFWLHTYHPNNWGAFNRQRNFDKENKEAKGWVTYSDLIYQFISQTSPQ